MDRRQFTAGGYTFDVRLHTGPGPYLIKLPGKTNEREQSVDSGEYLLYEGDKIVGWLPKHIIDALALPAEDEVHTIERVRMLDDSHETVDYLAVELGPGEKFDGIAVKDSAGNVLEKELQPVVLPSTPDLDVDGEPKSEEVKEAELFTKQVAVGHPVNRFNEASGRAAKEVLALETKKLEDEKAGVDEEGRPLEKSGYLREPNAGVRARMRQEEQRQQQIHSSDLESDFGSR